MKGLNIELNNDKIKKKTQKGKLSLFKRKGYFLNNSNFSLYLKISKILTISQLNSLNKSIMLFIPKDTIKLWTLPILISRVKRSGTRMGKGKGKINTYIYRLPINRNICRLNIDLIDNNHIISKIEYIKKYMETFEGLKKICNKHPYLGIKCKHTL